MTQEEEIKELEDIYIHALEKLKVLAQKHASLIEKRDSIVKEYVQKLEKQKIEAIRAHLGLHTNQ